VNDGSKENLSEFNKKYSDKITYISKENGGPGSARNVGIEEAKGEYIAFLDSDDLWREDKLEKQVNVMNETKAIWSHTNYLLFRDRDPHHVYKRIDVSDFQGMVFPKCLLSAPIATPCVMIRSSYLKENPMMRFLEKMRYGQDSFLWMNLAIDHSLIVVPEDLTKVRIRGINAAFRAKVQLQVKAQLWEHIKKNPTRYYGKGKMDFVIRSAYQYCFAANKIVEYLEKKNYVNKYIIEIISKILYLSPYLVFKIYYNFL